MFSILLINITPAIAQTSSEIEINTMFKEINDIVFNMKSDKYDLTIDYSIEILKYRPASLETYFTLSLIKNIDPQNNNVKKKFSALKDKYFADLEDFSSHQSEKIILIFLIGLGIESTTYSENLSAQKFALEKFIQMNHTCSNDNYAALALMMLFLDKNQGLEYMKNFKDKYPKHSFLPLIELDLIAENFNKKDYQKCIEEAKTWEQKYKNISSPYGWPLTIECYNLIILCYVSLKDHENAKKYFEIIKKEAPQYNGIKEIDKLIKYIIPKDN